MKERAPLKASEELSEYLISSVEAKEMHENYISNQLTTLNKENTKSGEKFNETQSVWIPIDVLQEYLEYIKIRYRQVADEKQTYGKISGVRMYLSAYSEGGVEKFGDDKKRLNITMVPTIEYKDKDVDKSFTKKDKEKYSHLKHIAVFLDGKNTKTIKKYKHVKPTTRNENTALIGKPFPPPPQGR